MANRRRGTLYIGVTADLFHRIYEHKNGLVEGFTKKYNIHTLVYYEEFGSIEDAILREKKLKRWNRKWKIELIEGNNSYWRDLYQNFTQT